MDGLASNKATVQLLIAKQSGCSNQMMVECGHTLYASIQQLIFRLPLSRFLGNEQLSIDEIQDKYVVGHFKECPSKHRALKFETINLEIKKPSAKCTAFSTSEDRILHWIRSLQLCSFDPLKDNDQFLIDWINHENYNSTSFQDL